MKILDDAITVCDKLSFILVFAVDCLVFCFTSFAVFDMCAIV